MCVVYEVYKRQKVSVSEIFIIRFQIGKFKLLGIELMN